VAAETLSWRLTSLGVYVELTGRGGYGCGYPHDAATSKGDMEGGACLFTSVFGWVKRQGDADACSLLGVAQGDFELGHDRALRDSESIAYLASSLSRRLSIVQCLSEASQEASM
jgi:hypothetical protein